jgi:hypothetical protein
MKPVFTQPGRKPKYHIFRASYTKNGIVYRAKDYGYKAWRIPIY